MDRPSTMQTSSLRVQGVCRVRPCRNLEAAKRNRIRHSDEIRRGRTPSLDGDLAFDFLYVDMADEGPTDYTVLDR